MSKAENSVLITFPLYDSIFDHESYFMLYTSSTHTCFNAHDTHDSIYNCRHRRGSFKRPENVSNVSFLL